MVATQTRAGGVLDGSAVDLLEAPFGGDSRQAGGGKQGESRDFSGAGAARMPTSGYAACDGGGRWRVYGTRVVSVGDGTLEAVLGHRLAEGLETRRQG